MKELFEKKVAYYCIKKGFVREKILKHLNLWEDKNNKSPPEEKEEITYERVEDEYAVNF